jgi:hypothetical protein
MLIVNLNQVFVRDIWILTPALVELRHDVSDDAKIVVTPSGDVGPRQPNI